MKQSKGIFCVLMAALLFSIGGLCIKLVPWSPFAINGARNGKMQGITLAILQKCTKRDKIYTGILCVKYLMNR